MILHSRVICCVVVLICSVTITTNSQSDRDIERLYAQKQYFDLRDALRKYQADQSAHLDFYRGVVSNKFNQPLLSIKYLQQYLKREGGGNNSLSMDCYELLAEDYIHIYEYRKAAETYRLLLGKFERQLKADKVKEIRNDTILFNALSEAPPQSAQIEGVTQLRTSRDKASLINIPIEIGARQMAWVFDTGANLSSITASCAKQMGVKIIDSYFEVGTSTNVKVKARAGIAPVIKIGQVTIRNVALLVFEDKDLFFPQIDYQINGILGLPVITALGELTFTRNGDLIIPEKPHTYDEQNLCLDGLMPLISGTYNGKRLAFKFDSGADSSALSHRFFKEYEHELKAHHTLATTKFAGAGGAMEAKSYRLEKLTLEVSGKKAEFAEIRGLIDPLNESDHYIYGTLGQDLIKQFERMTLNFKSMNVFFD